MSKTENQPEAVVVTNAKPKSKVMTKWLIIIAVCATIWLLPIPEGLTVEAWRLFAIFVATIVGFILAPVPMGSMAILSLSICAVLKIAPLPVLLSGFANSTEWLVVAAVFLSRGFIKTGLARRISLMIVKGIGTSTLRLGYAIMFSDLAFGPAMPATTARGAGIVFPIIKGLCLTFDSNPGATARRIGAYLLQVEHHACCIVSAMFITAMGANPLAVALILKGTGVEITWMGWATAAFVPGMLSVLLVPYLLYKIFPPDLKETPEAPQMAREELQKVGPMSWREKVMLGVFFGTLILWMTGVFTKIDPTAVAFLGTAVILITSVITWKDLLDDNGAWDICMWLAVLLGMADLLSKLGVVAWMAKSVGGMLSGIPWVPTLVILILCYFYLHYLFASLTAHISAFLPPMLAIAIFSGAPPMLSALLLAFFSSLCGTLTHFSSGPAPILFGAGYVEQGTWWKINFIISITYLIIWLGIGPFWWKILGWW